MQSMRINEQYSIVTDTDRSSVPQRVLKHGDSFAVFDANGDVIPAEAGEHGLYDDGTRFLSRFEFLLASRRPLLLSSTVSDDNAVFTADLTNPDIRQHDAVAMPRGQIHFSRSRVLWDRHWIERVRVSNHSLQRLEVAVSFRFDADFADLFEVRGTRRARRGTRLPDTIGPEYILRYHGLDHVERRTRIRSHPPADDVQSGSLSFTLHLDPHGTSELEVTISCEADSRTTAAPAFDDALANRRRALSDRLAPELQLVSSNASMNRWVRRSFADLRMMITETPHGLYPYAGIPWFSTPFGRDGLITALELLWADPAIARGVLAYLADTQATTHSDVQDAQPGKILHELRLGEMAALGEVPFGRYYGTADATPLFVMLADSYFRRTADRAFVDRIWPNIVAALAWMDTDGDPDGDGFIEYARESESGLAQQGWKDSYDSIFHADGSLAEPPIALCEVQGYAYAAWAGASRLAAARGEARLAEQWSARADVLRAAFDDAFWCDELETYAVALDGGKRQCRVRTSNPGHCLFAGIATNERAARVAATLMAEPSFTGWGIRTVATGEARYNPMSYHNGSVWPHDTAVVAAGLGRYGMTELASRILGAMFDLSQVVDLHRLPELICGFSRRGAEFPTLYPVACAPQAWATGAVFLLLQAALGLQVDASTRRVSFTQPTLPDPIDWLKVTNLTVGDASVDLLLERHQHSVGVRVLRREGDLQIYLVK
jgi:glycogen debranching enzyme